MDKHLSLIVARASPVDVVAANDRREGRRKPFLERFGRLNVIVPVDENCRPAARSATPGRVDDWVGMGRDESQHVRSERPEMLCEPRGATSDVVGVSGLRADRSETDEGCEFILVALLRI
jgi:hypothetical protein